MSDQSSEDKHLRDEAAREERKLIFTHEEFAIRTLQVVAGGALVALTAFSESAASILPIFTYPLAFSLFLFSIACSALASVFRYYFKLYDI